MNKRPVAFRVPRMVGDKLSSTKWQLFNDEGDARAEAEAKGCEYQGLYARDGEVVPIRDEDAAWSDWFRRAQPFDGAEEAFRAGFRSTQYWYDRALEYKQMHEMAVLREKHLEGMLRDRPTERDQRVLSLPKADFRGPFFSTQWECEDYERRQRGELELGPGAPTVSIGGQHD